MARDAKHASDGRVRSRVAWGAILAGTSVAIALFMVLGPLFVAVNLSLARSTGIAKIVSLLSIISMFVGAWVAAHLAKGETAGEALLYGVIHWTATAVVLLYFAMNGILMAGSLTVLGQIGSDVSPLADDISAAWWSFGGAALSLAASIVGASMGGPWLNAGRERPRQVAASAGEAHA